VSVCVCVCVCVNCVCMCMCVQTTAGRGPGTPDVSVQRTNAGTTRTRTGSHRLCKGERRADRTREDTEIESGRASARGREKEGVGGRGAGERTGEKERLMYAYVSLHT